MNLNRRAGGVLVALWVLCCVTAFWFGRHQAAGEAAPGPSTGQTSGAIGAPVSSGSALGDALRSADGETLTGLPNIGAVGRLLSFARHLSTEELERLLPEITENMTEAEVREALRRLLDEVEPGPARRLARLELVDRWGQLDAMAAMLEIEGLDEPALRDSLKKRVIHGWASVDPRAAHHWIQGAQNLPPEAIQSIWRGIAHTKDLPGALAFIQELGPGTNQYSEPYEKWDAYMVLHDHYRKDPETVTKWVESLPPGQLRSRTLLSTVDQWARHDPQAALAWADEHAGASDRQEVYVEVAESWARHDPESAVEWAAGLSADTEGLRRIYERLFTRFIQYDYLDAANYLVEQPPAPALDTAYEVYIGKVKSIDPARTMAWAEAITDPSRRDAAIAEVAGAWRASDRAGLRQWIESSNLPDEKRRALLAE